MIEPFLAKKGHIKGEKIILKSHKEIITVS